MIKVLRVSRDYRVVDVAYNSKSHEIVVPNQVVGDHEESNKSLRQKQLLFLVVAVSEKSRIRIGITLQELIPC